MMEGPAVVPSRSGAMKRQKFKFGELFASDARASTRERVMTYRREGFTTALSPSATDGRAADLAACPEYVVSTTLGAQCRFKADWRYASKKLQIKAAARPEHF